MLMSWRSHIDLAVKRMRKAVARRIAAFWQYTYRTQHQFGVWQLRYGSIAFYVLLLLLVSVSAYLSSDLQNVLAGYYSTEHAIEGLRNLILNVGSALIGAAAIVTSLVLFAMQVNIKLAEIIFFFITICCLIAHTPKAIGKRAEGKVTVKNVLFTGKKYRSVYCK